MKIENIEKAEELLRRRQNIKDLLSSLSNENYRIKAICFVTRDFNADILTREVENEMLIPGLQKKLKDIDEELQKL